MIRLGMVREDRQNHIEKEIINIECTRVWE